MSVNKTRAAYYGCQTRSSVTNYQSVLAYVPADWTPISELKGSPTTYQPAKIKELIPRVGPGSLAGRGQPSGNLIQTQADLGPTNPGFIDYSKEPWTTFVVKTLRACSDTFSVRQASRANRLIAAIMSWAQEVATGTGPPALFGACGNTYPDELPAGCAAWHSKDLFRKQ